MRRASGGGRWDDTQQRESKELALLKHEVEVSMMVIDMLLSQSPFH